MSEPSETIVSRLSETRRFEPSDEFRKTARIASLADYQKLYRESLDEPDAFWKRETASLRFRTPWHTVSEWKPPHAKWFLGATLNVTESCLDQHLDTAVKDKRALVWEGEPEEDGPVRRYPAQYRRHREDRFRARSACGLRERALDPL